MSFRVYRIKDPSKRALKNDASCKTDISHVRVTLDVAQSGEKEKKEKQCSKGKNKYHQSEGGGGGSMRRVSTCRQILTLWRKAAINDEKWLTGFGAGQTNGWKKRVSEPNKGESNESAIDWGRFAANS